jgi:predicted ATPase/class 3 adenylate cyclase
MISGFTSRVLDPDTASSLPTGRVTFMFTDIEGSTRHVQTLAPDAFSRVISRHHSILRASIQNHDGIEVGTEGDAFFAVFTTPVRAIEAASDIQEKMRSEPWPEDIDIRVRIGIHTGAGVLGGDNYVGVDVHRASRISHAAHGGQVVLSDTAATAVRGSLPEGAAIDLLGKFQLAGFREAEPIHQLVMAGLASKFPPLRGVRSASRLPTPLTEFVGREDELDLGERLLSEHRLLTLTGPGGTGKTRLSIELARRVEASLRDGAQFVSLAPIRDAELIATTILEALEMKTASNVDPADHLRDYLVDREMLLVLDNLEQFLDSGAAFVAGLLAAAGDVKVIATTRAPLRIMGERELPVPPLPVPEPTTANLALATGYAGVKLFTNRAAAVRPSFELNEANLAAVLSLTKRLDGLPLAIELAASQLRTFTPELILQRLDNRMLASRSPDVPERQQTIINAIGWSYDLLGEQARSIFERCSVFSGSFGLTEAEAVCSAEDPDTDVLGGLASLVENSLLQHEESSGDPRYRMLIVIKEYAYAALTTRDRPERYEREHARVYLDLAETADRELLTSKQGPWLDRLTSDHDNLRTAFDWAVRNDETTMALCLVASLWRFWQIRGHLPEARQKVETALAMTGGEPRWRAKALIALGGIRYWQGAWTETLGPNTEAVAILREHGDDRELVDALYNLSFPLGFSGEYDEAKRLLREALEISERIGDPVGISRAYWGLGDVAGFEEDWHAELEMMGQALRHLEGVDAPFDRGWAHFMTAYGHHNLGDDQDARQQLLAALEIFAEVTDLSAMTLIFESLALNAVRGGDRRRAALLAGAAHRIKADTGVAITEVEVNRFPEIEALLASEDEALQAAYHEGFEMSLEEVVTFAQE